MWLGIYLCSWLHCSFLDLFTSHVKKCSWNRPQLCPVGTDWNWLCFIPLQVPGSLLSRVSWLSRTLSYLDSMGLRSLKNNLSNGKSCGGIYPTEDWPALCRSLQILPFAYYLQYGKLLVAPQKGNVSLSLVLDNTCSWKKWECLTIMVYLGWGDSFFYAL